MKSKWMAVTLAIVAGTALAACDRDGGTGSSSSGSGASGTGSATTPSGGTPPAPTRSPSGSNSSPTAPKAPGN